LERLIESELRNWLERIEKRIGKGIEKRIEKQVEKLIETHEKWTLANLLLQGNSDSTSRGETQPRYNKCSLRITAQNNFSE